MSAGGVGGVRDQGRRLWLGSPSGVRVAVMGQGRQQGSGSQSGQVGRKGSGSPSWVRVAIRGQGHHQESALPSGVRVVVMGRGRGRSKREVIVRTFNLLAPTFHCCVRNIHALIRRPLDIINVLMEEQQ